ncbi:MAG TPA: helix-turn-helix transcriptional regulator [Roseiarcus sp.]|nr:helix-turn-helix transcriptional regulator [Roseiarcus sp.]
MNEQRPTEAETSALAFVAKVGEQVRRARERNGLTRKRLSELSGVSLRYLAQLEAGEGNISIALLHRVAAALAARVEALVGGDGAPEAGRVALLYGAASPAARARVLEILDPQAHGRRERIALIGLRGAGKTTLGRRLGESLNLPFVELNREIEAQSGMAVNEVIALYGQEGYRRLERQAVERVAATRERLVLAAAGGLVTAPDTFSFLLAHFHTVWLKAAPEEHMQRVRAQGDERPMAGNPKAMEELNALLAGREALYASAAATVDTSGRTLAASTADLERAVRGLGVL